MTEKLANQFPMLSKLADKLHDGWNTYIYNIGDMLGDEDYYATLREIAEMMRDNGWTDDQFCVQLRGLGWTLCDNVGNVHLIERINHYCH